MGFEKIVLEAATESGIEDAYFYHGTLFIAPDNCFPSTPDALDKFEANLKSAFLRAKPKFTSVGDEIAVDFTV